MAPALQADAEAGARPPPSEMNMETLELLEWHDAIIDRVTLGTAGNATIGLAHMAGYERCGPDSYDVVSYEARLIATDVTELHWRGAPGPDGWVSSIRVDGEELESGTTGAINAKLREEGLLEVLLTNGAVLELRCKASRIELGARNRVIERWEGPLAEPGEKRGGLT
jgi:hypothetical protein